MSSRAFHEWLKRRLAFITMKIRHGPLKGKSWNISSGSKFIRGEYEPDNTRAIEDLVRPRDVVFDIGAHVGYFTVLMSQRVGPQGRVVSFEPRDINLDFLRQHVLINGCGNVKIVDACVGDHAGAAKLETRVGTGKGFVSDDGNVAVRMVVLDELVQSGELPAPQFMKIDVEGGEMMVLEGARQIIEAHRPRMVLATHSPELRQKCSDFLTARGYEMQDIQASGDGCEWRVIPVGRTAVSSERMG